MFDDPYTIYLNGAYSKFCFLDFLEYEVAIASPRYAKKGSRTKTAIFVLFHTPNEARSVVCADLRASLCAHVSSPNLEIIKRKKYGCCFLLICCETNENVF